MEHLIYLETGGTDAVVNYTSGSGTPTLVFEYTVSSGHTSNDLDYVSTSALALNNGSISDAAGNAAILTLAATGSATSLGGQKGFVIDTSPATIASISSSASDATYKIGDVIPISITFSEVVTVTGIPQLTLETGETDAVVNYTSGSGSTTLLFNYTVSSGQASNDLDYAGTDALSLNGGTILDASGNASVLTLASPGATNSLGANKALIIDGIVPSVSSVASSTSNGIYKIGETVAITVTFSEAVTVNGSPQLTLETGSSDAVNYTSGSGSSTLIFNYTIIEGHQSADLAYSGTDALALNGGSILDAAGNNASLTLVAEGQENSLSSNAAIIIDGVIATVVSVTSTSQDGFYNAGDNIPITITFSEVINVTNPISLDQVMGITLETGDTDAIVNYSSGTGTSTLTFNYVVSAGHTSPDLEYVATNALNQNNSTVVDVGGNSANLTLPSPGATNSLGANKSIIIDTEAPTVTSVTSTINNGTYVVDDVIPITVNFSEIVTVSGTPQITLETGANDAIVNYSDGSGSTLWFLNILFLKGITVMIWIMLLPLL